MMIQPANGQPAPTNGEKALRTEFTADELNTLRTGFATIGSVNTDRLTQFRKIFDGCEDAALRQLADAQIKFVSKLAANACARRGIMLAAATPADNQSEKQR